MDAVWDQELTSEEEEALVTKYSSEIKRRGMEVPAILFLEMHKPLANIASSGLVVVAPFVVPFVGVQNLQDFRRLLSRPAAYEKLIVALEAPRQPDSQPA
jgi:hypothetical protein